MPGPRVLSGGGDEGKLLRESVRCQPGFFCVPMGRIFVGWAVGGTAGVVPSGLALREDLAVAVFFLAFLVLDAVLVRRHDGRLAQSGFALAAASTSFKAPAADACLREELPLVPALLGSKIETDSLIYIILQRLQIQQSQRVQAQRKTP